MTKSDFPPSPHKPHINDAVTFSSQTKSGHGDVREELSNKIELDDHEVFKRIKVTCASEAFAQECAAELRIHKSADIRALQDMTARASTNKNEKFMYNPLVRSNSLPHLFTLIRSSAIARPQKAIFEYIEGFRQETHGKPVRQFVRNNKLHRDPLKTPTVEPHTVGFPDLLPDFCLSRADTEPDSRLWSDKDGICEVKASSTDSPYNGSAAIPVIFQSANYARLHSSAKPFNLFSVSLLICGDKFCVAIHDRGGVVVSPEHDMWKELETFVRVVRSLTHELSEHELGLDKTVDRHERYFNVKPIGHTQDRRWWKTVGVTPIWSSLSLLGRGTEVWFVQEYDPRTNKAVSIDLFVMKSAWRHKNRHPESDICKAIQKVLDSTKTIISIAKFETGGDVCVGGHSPPSGSTPVLTVAYLRGHKEDVDNPLPVLHRVVWSTLGKPMWEYSSDLELLKGFRAAIIGESSSLAPLALKYTIIDMSFPLAHETLVKRDILHRDISAGNVLLAKDLTRVSPGCEGFLTDFEFATVPPGLEFEETKRVPPITMPGGGSAEGKDRIRWYTMPKDRRRR